MRGFLLVVSLAGDPRQTAPDAWFGQDKLKHFCSAFFVQSMSYGVLRAAGVSHGVSLGGATAASASASIGKEVWDAFGHGTPSARDLVWDAAGAGAATALLVRVHR